MVDKGLILFNRPDDPTTYTLIPWRTTSTPDLAVATDDIHKLCSRAVCTQLGGSDHKPIILYIQKNAHPEQQRQNQAGISRRQIGTYSRCFLIKMLERSH